MKLLLWLMLRYKGGESSGCFGYVQGKKRHFACLNRVRKHMTRKQVIGVKTMDKKLDDAL